MEMFDVISVSLWTRAFTQQNISISLQSKKVALLLLTCAGLLELFELILILIFCPTSEYRQVRLLKMKQ